MNDRDTDIIRQAKAYERIINADPHNRRPAQGRDIGALKTRKKRRHSNRWVRRLVRD